MKTNSHFRVALSAALGLSLVVLPAARAQNVAPVRVVRLARAEGQVLVSHSGSDIWEEAPVNLPLQEGDTIATQDGLAALEFENGATAYLAENSVLQFTQLGFSPAGDRATELTLTQGAGTFYANLASQDSFVVHTSTFDVAIPTRAEFRVDAFQDGAAAEVFLGDVSVSTTKGSTDLVKGQSVAVHEKDFQDMSIGSLPTAEDAFDQWVIEHGQIIRSGNKNTLSYINSPNSYGLSDLSMYGSWISLAEFGGFAWRPFSLGLNWAPYFNGTWRLDPLLGWIWVSSEPWGWTPYHFGSWLLSPVLGWVWVPGKAAGLAQWQPARVNWVRTGNQFGWVAISPIDRDGVPANAAHGVIAMPVRSSRSGIGQNEIVPVKDLHGVTQLKQPPKDFASPPPVSALSPETGSTNRTGSRSQYDSGSIVLDRQTHTFVNGNNAGSNAPVAAVGVMPPINRQTGVPRVMQQSTATPPVNRVPRSSRYLPAPASRENDPAYGSNTARPPISTPPNIQPRPVAPSSGVQTPTIVRPAAPPPVPVRPPEPPSAPRTAPTRPGRSAAPEAAREPKSVSPPH